jgi:hypothetical protein
MKCGNLNMFFNGHSPLKRVELTKFDRRDNIVHTNASQTVGSETVFFKPHTSSLTIIINKNNNTVFHRIY